jgi:hypothetical protein
MASILKVDTIQDQSGNNIINESADTITIGASGDTVNIVGTLQNNGSGVIQGITEADQWRLTANVTLTNPAAFVTSNWERNDNSGYGGIGTGMTESSGVFSFPSTGIYLIQSNASFQQSGGTSDENALFTYSTINNSSYTQQTSNLSAGATGTDHNNASSSFLFDVTDVSNCKVKFEQYGFNAILRGSSTQNRTHITFIRLGDT